jgi:hypothetical protein
VTNDQSEEDEVLSLHYQGYTHKEIHAKIGPSTGKISGFVTKDKKRLGAGVAETIRQVSKRMHESKYTWDDIAAAVAMTNYCKMHSINIEEIKDSLPAIIEKLNEHGLSISDLPQDIQSMVKKKDGLVARTNSLKDEIKGLVDDKSKILKDHDHTEESIKRCRELSDFLRVYNIPPDAPEKLRNAIKNAEESGFNGKEIAEKASSVKSLEEERKALEETVSFNREEAESWETKAEALKIKFWKDQSIADALEFLQEKGVESLEILAFSDLVKRDGSDLAALSSKVVLNGSLDKTIVQSQERISDLEKVELKMRTIVETLEKKQTSLEASNDANEQIFKKSIQSMIDAANDGSAKISEASNATAGRIATIAEQAEKVTNAYARSHGTLIFEPLIRVVNGESVPINEVRIAAVFAMDILRSRIPVRAGYARMLESVIKDVKDDPSLGIFP